MKKYTHFSLEERMNLYALLQSGKNKKQIAKTLGRHMSSVYREIRRNKKMIGIRNNNNPKAKKIEKNYHYLPEMAQQKYQSKRKGSKQGCPLKTPDLYEYVIEKLKIGWSPLIISGRAKLEQIGSISHECIYQYIYSSDARIKNLELWKYLVRSHKRRRRKKDRKAKRTLIPNRIGIEMRPKEVESRHEFGHWEDDSIVGVGKGAALNTKRERKTRYLFAKKIPRKTADNTAKVSIKFWDSLPPEARKSNTCDNGSEFTKHEKVTQKTGVKYFFANPYASWERGTNENGNGLIRRSFPKKTDFNKVSHKQIQLVVDAINHRPLVCLDFKTPHEAFFDHLSCLSSPP